MDGSKTLHKLLKIALKDLIQLMKRQADAMIGDPILRVIIGADFLASLPRPDL